MLRRYIFILSAVLVLSLFRSPPALYAAGIVVDSTADTSIAGDELCTLREAINNANADTDTTDNDCVAGSGHDTITFLVTGDIVLSSQLPAITDVDGLSIDGGGNVTISGNNAVRVLQVNTGAVLNLHNITITRGADQVGGAIYNDGGTVTVTDSTLSHNSASGLGGNGGAIHNAFGGGVTVTNSTLSHNSASGLGGAIYTSGGTVHVTGSTLNENSATSGAIHNHGGTVHVTNSTLSYNSASNAVTGGFGGAIHNSLGGTLYVTNSTLSHNTAFALSSGLGGNGGAIYNDVGSTVTVAGSTLSHNTAANGGAIYNFGAVTVTNSTLSHNTASGSNGFGGGIHNTFGGMVTLTNSTLSHNSAARGGGINNSNASSVTVANSIIANSPLGGDCQTFSFDGSGIVDRGHNLVGSGTCGFAAGGDPKLGPLQNNGGPTETHELLPDSPAIDAGDNDLCEASPVDSVDQRGVARPQGALCDIGAFERVQTPTAVELASFTATASGGVVLLAWETAAEIDNAGFHLHRAPSPAGPYIRITDSLIAAQGTLHAGAVYTYTDSPGDGIFYYTLEDIDTGGTSTVHGPVAVRTGAPATSGGNSLFLPRLFRN